LVAYGAYKYLFTGEDSIVCTAQKLLFLGDLQNEITSMSGSQGYKSTDSFSFKIPCDGEIYFIDSGKRKELLDSKSLDNKILLKDAVESGTANVIVMEGDKILLSRNISGLNIPYPHNLCFGSNRKVKVEILGLGAAGAQMTPSCDAIECTVVPEDLTTDEIENLLNDACKDDSDITDCKNRESQNIQNAKGNIELSLKVSTCFPETTKVEFIIKPREGIAGNEVKIIYGGPHATALPKESLANLAARICEL